MIELPESQTLSRQMTQALSGKTIVHAIAGFSPHGFAFYTGDPALYGDRLRGQQVRGAAAMGGQVELELGPDCLLFNDGTNLRQLSPDQPEPAKHQLYLAFDDGSALSCSVQMYGGMALYEKGTNDNPYYQVAVDKPSPLEAAFDAAYFDRLFAGSKQNLSLKGFLATEQRIPGLGNGVLQDILFDARLHPKRKLSTLTDAQRQDLYDSVKSTLAEMTRGGGRDTEKDLFGQPGGYHSTLSSKTYQDPCPVCGAQIVRQAYLGGNIYFCPECQPV